MRRVSAGPRHPRTTSCIGSRRRAARLALGAAGLSAALALAPPSSRGAGTPVRFDDRRPVPFRPPARTMPDAAPAAAFRPDAAAATGGLRSVPVFQSAFTDGGQAYTYTMVGTDPTLPAATTTVPTVVVPIRFVFSNGAAFGGSSTVRQLKRSPLFRPSAFASGVTQYGDAIRRADFWTYTRDAAYHVLLRRPRTTSTAVVHVPARLGFTATSVFGGPVGVVTESFFSGTVVPKLINRMHLPPTALIVFWTKDVDLQPSGLPGAILGEHSAGSDAGRTTLWTWAFAAWHSDDTISPGGGDVAVLSHEIAEWYADPFASNVVPPTLDPADSTCLTVLEVGDPLTGVTFAQDGYHLQDEAFLSWFARQVPSVGLDGRYSYLGTLVAPASSCTGS